ncbi:imelysin family protein [Paraliomyxa miuraensis]|uniref:imelysin family protein n=1 Tax=Paraliomyxa miuraensis TaxID=376150 RepID=UPI00225153E4|nr:imelysin family protein [Paraliomyxa miuraensis]MCX4242476.1 imelysin family protein [Paraliomyxa miuraensis]
MTPRKTERASLRPWLLPIVLAGLGALGWACRDVGEDGDGGHGSTSDTDGGGAIDRAAVLESIALQVLVPSTADFAARVQALDDAVQTHASAMAADPTTADEPLATAQEAWREAMTQQQVLEVMQIGPAAPSISAPGGEDRRDGIYSWPTADTCAVDRALAEARYEADDFFQAELVLSYGLDALEYLLFVHDDGHTCPAQVQLDGPWAALGPDELERRRSAYAARLAAELAAQGAALAERWSPAGGDFAAALAEPGQGASPYASEAQALDDVFRAMFYVDKQTKDAKLGVPLGIVEGCAAVPCVSLMETQWSGDSAAFIAANLRGLQLVLDGGPDPATADGFDDLLAAIGQEEIAQTLRTDIAAAIELAEGLPAPLTQLAATDPAQAQALYDALKKVTDTLKGPFVMALMLTIPAEGAGDND